MRGVIGIAIGSWVIRYLGPEKFGTLNFCIAFVAVFSSVASVGLNGIAQKAIIQNRRLQYLILGSCATLQILGALISISIILGSTYISELDYEKYRILFAILSAGFLFKTSEVLKYWFETEKKVFIPIWVELVAFLCVTLLRVMFILSELGLFWFAGLILLESCLIFSGMIFIYSLQNKFALGLWSASKSYCHELIQSSWPAIFSGFVLLLQASSDLIVLGMLSSPAEVGYYSSALRLIEVAAVLPMLLRSSYLPMVLEKKTESDEGFNLEMINYYRLSFITAVLILIPICIFSKSITHLFFGEQFAPAAILLAFMSFRILFVHMGVARSVYLLASDYLRYSLVTTLLGAALNIALNFILIEKYGALGAILANSITYVFIVFIVDFISPNTRLNAKLMYYAIFTSYKLLKK